MPKHIEITAFIDNKAVGSFKTPLEAVFNDPNNVSEDEADEYANSFLVEPDLLEWYLGEVNSLIGIDEATPDTPVVFVVSDYGVGVSEQFKASDFGLTADMDLEDKQRIKNRIEEALRDWRNEHLSYDWKLMDFSVGDTIYEVNHSDKLKITAITKDNKLVCADDLDPDFELNPD